MDAVNTSLLELIYSPRWWWRVEERLRLAGRINDGNHHIHRICRQRSRAEPSRSPYLVAANMLIQDGLAGRRTYARSWKGAVVEP